MTNFRTCSLDKPWYGCSASVLISHSTTPNDLQTHTYSHMWSKGTSKVIRIAKTARRLQSCDLPAVGVGSEDSVLQRLWSHPPDRKQALTSLTVVVSLIDVSGHTKVYERERERERFMTQFNNTNNRRRKRKQTQAKVPPILTVKSSATMQFLAARSLWTNFLALR